MTNIIESLQEYSIAVNVQKSTINIYTGKDAISQISKDELVNDWHLLYETCSWATIYQSIDFVANWYKVYQAEHLPILVLAVENERLIGALALCMDGKRRISGAGLHQAEYQTWISSESDNGHFIKEALIMIKEKWPGYRIQLKYLPEKTPLSWITTSSLEKASLLQTVEHPIMSINKEMLEKELRKKNRREKVNRLKRLGALTLQRITDYTDFESIFEELSTLNDFRKGAVYNVTDFQRKDLFREFLLALFQSGILHVTILKVDEEIIAANVGAMGKKWLHLQGINAHSPAYAKYSPGILHFLMMGQLLADEGFEVFDLTPGSDAYKKILATDFIVAHQLDIADTVSTFLEKNRQVVRHQLKSLSSKIGIDVQAQRDLKKKTVILLNKIALIKKRNILSLVHLINSELRYRSVEKRFRVDVNLNNNTASNLEMNKNCIRDLLKFKPEGTLSTPWEFLEDAMSRLEKGQQPYTVADESKLLLVVWEEKESLKAASNRHDLKEDGLIRLTNLYYHPHAKGLVKEFVEQVAKKILKENITSLPNVYIHVNSSIADAAIKKSGFIQIYS